jgi:hypothetical protein
MIAMILSVALAGTAVADGEKAAPEPPKKYTPEIRGQLLDGTKAVSSNVCLRQSGSEIRMCGYTDYSGNFYIPAHSARPVIGDTSTPTFWLEIGRVTEAKKIGAVEASEDKRASIALECNLARSGGKADATSICDHKAAADSVASRGSKGESARTHPAHPAQ